jgi:hypothetical protein
VAHHSVETEVRTLLKQILRQLSGPEARSSQVRCEICFAQRSIDEMNPIFDPDDPEEGFLGWECWEHDV